MTVGCRVSAPLLYLFTIFTISLVIIVEILVYSLFFGTHSVNICVCTIAGSPMASTMVGAHLVTRELLVRALPLSIHPACLLVL